LKGKFLKDIKCSNLTVNGKPNMTTFDYEMDIHNVEPEILTKLRIDPAEQVSVLGHIALFLSIKF